jgi:F-type H+-transporting ATPase subunit delta
MADTDTHAVYDSPSTDQVTDVYAQALVELGEQHGHLDELADEVQQLRELLQTEPDLRRLIFSRIIGQTQRAAMLQRLFQGRVSDTLYNFLQVLSRKGRLVNLPGVLTDFARKMDERRGIVPVDAFVAQPMDSAHREQVAAALGEALGGKTVQLRERVDPSLIGGLKLRIGDKQLDGSVATQLRLMRRRMIDAGREKARQQAAGGQGSGAGEEVAEGPSGPVA